MTVPDDPYNAFCRHTHVELDGAIAGPLRGLNFAVKDVFDIAGHRTGNGHPLWMQTHPPDGLLGHAPPRRRRANDRQDPYRRNGL